MCRRRIVVTGGAGFIGSHLVDRLLDRGDEVICFDNFNDAYAPDLKRENVAAHLQRPGYRLVEVDIRERARIAELLAELRPAAVVHLAARAGVRPSLRDPFLYQETNVAGTLNLFDGCRDAGVSRMIFGSSSSVYGSAADVPFSEEEPRLLPSSPYAATKIAGEAFAHSYAHLYGLEVASLRFFTVYGRRQRPDLAIRKFATRILRGEAIDLYGDGSSSRDYTHVDDIIAGVLAALDRTTTRYEVFNLGSAAPIALRELVATIEEATGVAAKVNWLPDQPGDVPRTFASIDRAGERLGYAPAVPFADGIADFVDWLRPRI
jgi:UDP-glucuronate 4-epimerase